MKSLTAHLLAVVRTLGASFFLSGSSEVGVALQVGAGVQVAQQQQLQDVLVRLLQQLVQKRQRHQADLRQKQSSHLVATTGTATTGATVVAGARSHLIRDVVATLKQQFAGGRSLHQEVDKLIQEVGGAHQSDGGTEDGGGEQHALLTPGVTTEGTHSQTHTHTHRRTRTHSRVLKLSKNHIQ